MAFYGSNWQDFPDTCRSTGAYIIFYQGVPIDHGKNVTVPVDQQSAESEYNAAWTAETTLAHFRMLIDEFLNRDPDIVPEEYSIFILDIKSAFCMANNGNYTKHTRHIYKWVHLARNGEK